MSKSVKVNYELKRDDLTCSTCYNDIQFPLFQCQKYQHFHCKDCALSERKCLECRSSIRRNKGLERQLEDQLEECPFEGCYRSFFPWHLKEHKMKCEFKESECPVCFETTSLGLMEEHITRECKFSKYLDVEGERGDFELQKRFQVGTMDISDLDYSFFIIYKGYIIYFSYAYKWYEVIIFSRKRKNIEIKCDTVKDSSKFQCEHLIKVKTCQNLSETNKPTLPLNAHRVEFIFPSKKQGEEREDTEDFFKNLFRNRSQVS